MPPPFSHWLQKRIRQTPLCLCVVVPFVAQLTLAVGITGWLAFKNGEKAVQDLAHRYQAELSDHIRQELEWAMEVPHKINRANADLVRQGLLDFTDPQELETYFWHQLQRFGSVNYIYAGNEQGGILGVGRVGDRTYRIFESGDFSAGEYSLYRADEQGDRQERLSIGDEFDARSRPWYEAAVAAKENAWSDVYLYTGEKVLGISASYPLYDAAGNLQGVFATDVMLSQISEFLQNLNVGEMGETFIVERSGDLVASSTGEPPYVTIAPGELQQRRHARASDIPLIQSTHRQLVEQFGSLAGITSAHHLTLRVEGDRYYVAVVPFQDGRGLDWLIVVAVPESDFMGQIRQNTRTTLWLCLGALVIAIGFGSFTTRWITQPITRLSEASRAIADGQFDRRVPVQRGGELGVLADSFNRMAEHLEDSFRALEQRNQELEERVAERTAYLTVANEKLQREIEERKQMEQSLRLLLRAVSHDLRNPVTGTLLVLNGLLSQSTASAPGSPGATGSTATSGGVATQETDAIAVPRRVLQRMADSSDRQLQLINSLLEVHQPEVGDGDGADQSAGTSSVPAKARPSMVLHRRPLSLHALILSLIQDVRHLFENSQVTLINRVPVDLPLVNGDPTQLWRVVENLLTNAVKHNPPQITVTVTAAVVASGDRPPQVRCQVHDTGRGIPPEQHATLFAPYSRGSGANHIPGLGLGLYLCQQIILAHGGSIGVESFPGSGTTFWFTLPLAPEESAAG
ncbi:MAG: ATP-binding protein [Synechococcales bacterium]|nr:ATP-binding protein [Synechococcales bacterium]